MEKVIEKVSELQNMDMSPSSVKDSIEKYYGEYSVEVRNEIFDKINQFKHTIDNLYNETKDYTQLSFRSFYEIMNKYFDFMKNFAQTEFEKYSKIEFVARSKELYDEVRKYLQTISMKDVVNYRMFSSKEDSESSSEQEKLESDNCSEKEECVRDVDK